MSSAEDMRIVTTSPSASSSEQQPADSAKTPAQSEASRLNPKPTMKTNMLAREVRVQATGVRPGKSAAERELFTEETNSVLVHENGGVIPLSATVERGQLLVLANLESKQEVVAQVRGTYKRNRYVGLEFAEAAPRFWGTAFSAAAALLPKDAKDAEAAALVISAEDSKPGEPPAPPTFEQVQALKREVEALREQASGPAATAGCRPTERDSAPSKSPDQNELLMPSLDFTVPLPKTRGLLGLLRAKGNFTPGFRGGVLRLTLLMAALLVTAAGTAWLKHGIPWRSAVKKPAVRVPTLASDASTPAPRANREVALENLEFIDTNVASDAPMTAPSSASRLPASMGRPVANGSTAPPPVRRRPPTATLAAKSDTLDPPARTTPDPVAPAAVKSTAAAESAVVPPKLITSVRAVASLDALRDFETGNVIIDAVVGTEGELHFIKVLSGPPSLRAPAVEAVKQYRYEPARQNGQPVPAHVTITIRFRFES